MRSKAKLRVWRGEEVGVAASVPLKIRGKAGVWGEGRRGLRERPRKRTNLIPARY